MLHRDWHPVAEAIEPGTVRSVKLLEREFVIWRCGDRILAWDDRCPHRGARLSGGTVEDRGLRCPYHGLVFNSQGTCVEVPASPGWTPSSQLCLSAYPAELRYGLVWLSLNPDADPKTIPSFPEWSDLNYRKFLCGAYRFRASPLRVMENFLDVSHFPFVHDGLLGDRIHTEVPDYQVHWDDQGLSIKDVQIWQPNPDGTAQGATVTYNYHAPTPLSAWFEKLSGDRRLTIFFAICPLEPELAIGWMWIAMNYGSEIPQAELHGFQDRVVRQDIPIVESQHPKRLPLTLSQEGHLPSDRASIAYRQWLQRRGVQFGAIAA
ncbi:MAG: ring-hydroxylating dioxygenase 2Fe-2S subunit [Phormidium sp. OSCR]|nr:MAG: ring-hydroxylating dioxygenase 2Fe-2S subunit [Phormidium sp. OSCR]